MLKRILCGIWSSIANIFDWVNCPSMLGMALITVFLAKSPSIDLPDSVGVPEGSGVPPTVTTIGAFPM